MQLTDCSNLSFTFEESFLQCMYRLYLPIKDIPDWFQHQINGSFLSFHMPQNFGDNFLGLTKWVVYVVSKANSEIRAVIRNTTDGTVKTGQEPLKYIHGLTISESQSR